MEQRRVSQCDNAARTRKQSVADSPLHRGIFQRSKRVGDRNWFRENLKLKNCSQFILCKEDNASYNDNMDKRFLVCVCGRRYDHHYPQQIKDRAEMPGRSEWSIEKHTKEFKTNAFGEIEFTGHSQKTAKYARLSIDSPMQTVYELLMNQWCIAPPKFVVIVLGGDRREQDKDSELEVERQVNKLFTHGLIKACTTKDTCGWIITGGAYTGVMDSVRDALSQNMVRPIMIGVTPWGNVAGRYKLTDRQGTGQWPAKHYIIRHPEVLEYSLDMHHSHFILVDDGTIRQRVKGMPTFRNNLIEELRKRFGSEVPFVNVMFRGGLQSLKAVADAANGTRADTPSVIVKGSGRAADVLAYAYETRRTKTNDKELYEKEVLPKMRQMIKDNLQNENEKKVLELIEACLSKPDMISVFDHSKKGIDTHLDRTILIAPIRVCGFADVEKLQMVMDWNRVDLAKNIFRNSKQKIEREKFSKLFSRSLYSDRPEFSDLFLDNGFNVSRYLTRQKLKDLYNKDIAGKPILGSNVKLLLKGVNSDYQIVDLFWSCVNGTKNLFRCGERATEERVHTLSEIKRIIGRLIPGYDEKIYSDDVASTELTENLLPEEELPDFGLAAPAKPDFEEPLREIFIWALLNNKPNVAKLFFRKQKNPMAAALLAVNLLRSMGQKSCFDDNMKMSLRQQATEFEHAAIDVLDACREAELEANLIGAELMEHKTELLLVRDQKQFGNKTCLWLAVRGKCFDFIANSSVQTMFDKLWRGKMSVDNQWWRITACVFCPNPFLIFSILFFYEDEMEVEQNKKRAKRVKGKTTTEAEEKEEIKQSQAKENKETKQSEDIQDKVQYVFDHYSLGRELSFWERWMYFFKAPITVFGYSVLAYLVFLGLFSYIVLSKFEKDIGVDGSGLSVEEMVLAAWIGTRLIEELRQLLNEGIIAYSQTMMNLFDQSAIWVFIVAFIMRFFEDTFEAARYLMCLSLVIFYIRLLHIFSVWKQLGPMRIIIRTMTLDLIFFMCFIAVFFWAYSVTWHAVLYPNSPMSIELIYAVFRAGYWSMLGEIQTFLDGEMEVGDCTMNNETGQLGKCSNAQLLAPPMTGLYVLFINILMFNLLIALFSHRFNEIYPDAKKYWNFLRYSLITEYRSRPMAPPPLIIIFHILQFLCFLFKMFLWCVCRCEPCDKTKKKIIDYEWPWVREIKLEFSDHETYLDKELSSWECTNADIKNVKKKEEEENSLKNVRKKVDQMTEKLENLVVMLKAKDADGTLSGVVHHWRTWTSRKLQQRRQTIGLGQPNTENPPQTPAETVVHVKADDANGELLAKQKDEEIGRPSDSTILHVAGPENEEKGETTEQLYRSGGTPVAPGNAFSETSAAPSRSSRKRPESPESESAEQIPPEFSVLRSKETKDDEVELLPKRRRRRKRTAKVDVEAVDIANTLDETTA